MAFWMRIVAGLCASASWAVIAQVTAASWAGAYLSGAWYDPARSGEGIVLEMLPNGKAIAVWFTYPASGGAGDQAWLIGDSGVVEGNAIQFDVVYRPQGGVFGAKFDANAVRREVWGTLRLEATGCNTLRVRYAGAAGFGSGERQYTRLTAIDEAQCGGARALTTSGARAPAGLRSKSGAWYVPARSGEGWLVEELPGDRVSIYWFTFDPQGNQAFVTGVGQRSGDTMTFNELYRTRGTRFGDAFESSKVELVPWGTLSMRFENCARVTVDYSSPLAGFGAGTLRADRLTALAGAPCLDGAAQPKLAGSWVESTAMIAPFSSEHAVVAYEEKIYVLGGIGDPRGFKVFDPRTAVWTRLPDMPSGRNHLAAFAGEGGIYFSGGETDDASLIFSGYRFDVVARTWTGIASLKTSFGSHAAVLHGRAYIGDQDGSLQVLDLRTQQVRKITGSSPSRARDHSQVVAFLEEIWVIAGRSPETRSVAIYDPVSETWRSGPSILRARGGFAAAVVDNQIVIAGGEVINGGVRLEESVEVFTALGEAWQTGPRLPVAVHGTAAPSLGGEFYLIGGSTRAGETTGANGRVWRWSPAAP
jgi:Kelch motif